MRIVTESGRLRRRDPGRGRHTLVTRRSGPRIGRASRWRPFRSIRSGRCACTLPGRRQPERCGDARKLAYDDNDNVREAALGPLRTLEQDADPRPLDAQVASPAHHPGRHGPITCTPAMNGLPGAALGGWVGRSDRVAESCAGRCRYRAVTFRPSGIAMSIPHLVEDSPF